ncbi:hypothetical protein D3C80_1486670 [compost metagenome]
MGNVTFPGVKIQRGQRSGCAAGVDGHRITLRRHDQPEPIATQAVHVWVDHGDGSGGGDHGFNRVAAFAQYRQCAFAGEVVRRDGHAQWRGVAVNHFLALV